MGGREAAASSPPRQPPPPEISTEQPSMPPVDYSYASNILRQAVAMDTAGATPHEAAALYQRGIALLHQAGQHDADAGRRAQVEARCRNTRSECGCWWGMHTFQWAGLLQGDGTRCDNH